MNGNQIREGLAHAEYLRVRALENRVAELEAALKRIEPLAAPGSLVGGIARDALKGKDADDR
jgi:hypothetical protein